MPKKNGKFTFDKNMTREQFLAQFGNNSSQPAESTGNAIAGGMKAEAILDAVRKERGRRAAVVATEKARLEKKGRLSWKESQKLDAYKNADVNEAYRHTNEYRDNMSLGERLLDAPKYKMNSSAGAIELFSPVPGGSVAKAADGVSAAKNLMTRGAYADKKLADLVEARRAFDKELKLFDSDPNYVREFPLHWYNDHRAATKKSILDDIYDNTLSQQYILDNYPSHLSYEIPGVDGPLLLGRGEIANPVYKINDLPGYQLKMLMRGNPLEKQISKSGTVNVNNIRSLANKGSNVEKTVIDKVLNGKFAGQKSVDYNQFRKAIQDELITYQRTPDTRWADYGIGRLGFEPKGSDNLDLYEYMAAHPEEFPEWEWITTPNRVGFGLREVGRPATASEINEWMRVNGKMAAPPMAQNTYTFSSPRIPMGSGDHYNPNTLGHSRTYTTADEPNILHVMESQSDWAQHGGRYRLPNIDEVQIRRSENLMAQIDKTNKLLQDTRNKLATDRSFVSKFGGEDNVKKYISRIENDLNELESRVTPDVLKQLNDKKILDGLYSDKEQAKYLSNNYTSKQIQENLRYAAENGKTKMRYPTRETAAKIEGYSKQRVSNPELDKKFWELEDELKRAEQAIYEKYLPQNYIDDAYRDQYYLGLDNIQRSEAFDKSPEAAKMRKELLDVREKINPTKWYRENVPEAYFPEHETILRKYDAFPKQYKKLFNGADVRTAVDAKGNSWYEVDVPKDYLNMEWPFASGGSIHIDPSKKGTFTAAASRHGKSVQAFASQVLANKENYSPAMVKKANFARNAAKWHADGGLLKRYDLGGNTQDAILYDYFQSNDSPLADTLLIQPQSANTPAYAVRTSGDAPDPVYMPVVDNPVVSQEPTFNPMEVTNRLKQAAAYAAATKIFQNTVPREVVNTYIRPQENTAEPEYTPSEDLIQSLIGYEGFLERPSRKIDGKWTIGYGDTDKALNDYYLKNPNKKYNKAEAEKRLRDRVANEFLPELKKSVPNWDRLTPQQKDSLLSYAYNVGKYFTSTHKNFVSAMKDFDIVRAAKELNAGWNQRDKSTGKILYGIRKRRIREQRAFLGDKFSVGGVIDKLKKTYSGDAKAMLEAVRKAKSETYEQM